MSMFNTLVIAYIIPQFIFKPATSELNSILYYYETLNAADIISSRVKRSSNGQDRETITVSFMAFQSRFKMTLTPDTNVLHPNAHASLVDGKGRDTPFEINAGSFYSGILNDNPRYEVDAAEIDGVWIAHIHTPDEFYALEPIRYYDRKANQMDVLIYRGRDIKASNQTQPFCGTCAFDVAKNRTASKKDTESDNKWNYSLYSIPIATEAGNNENSIFANYLSRQNSRIHRGNSRIGQRHTLSGGKIPPKRKRRSERATECDVLVICDYTFYRGSGRGSPANVISTVAQIFRLVNRIFRTTAFHDNKRHNGMTIAGFVIHNESSSSGYNVKNLNLSNLITALNYLAFDSRFGQYCVVHLIMERDLGITLGMGSVGDIEGKEGICGRKGASSHNIGVSTIVNGLQGKILTMREYSAVVAHEFGHNWGSFHDDPHNPVCSPSTENGGKYLMWRNRGFIGRNSYSFSPCSIASISKVLKKRARSCFMSRRTLEHGCGNGFVDHFEECDTGMLKYSNDPCCTPQCRLAPEAQCSPVNHACCTPDCKIAPPTKECLPAAPAEPCYQTSHCTGNNSWECSPSKPLPNRSPCGDQGWCWHGRCMSFCERLGINSTPMRDLRPCTCDQDSATMCRHCCFENNSSGPSNKGVCRDMGKSLKENAPCVLGRCVEGICTPHDSDDMLDFPQIVLPITRDCALSQVQLHVCILGLSILMGTGVLNYFIAMLE